MLQHILAPAAAPRFALRSGYFHPFPHGLTNAVRSGSLNIDQVLTIFFRNALQRIAKRRAA